MQKNNGTLIPFFPLPQVPDEKLLFCIRGNIWYGMIKTVGPHPCIKLFVYGGS